jgi:valacyclovir hydrolase
LISFDPRGYGESRPPIRTFGADYYHQDAKDALAVMDALGIDKFNVMGWSDGANSSVLLTASNPSRVEKLIIFGGNSYIDNEYIEGCESVRNISTWSQKMKESLLPIYGETDLQSMWSSCCDAMQTIYSLKGGDICQEDAKLLSCPVFVLGGDKDPIAPAVHPWWFYKNIGTKANTAPSIPKQVRIHMFPEGKHNVHIKYADEFNTLVEEFLLNTKR